MKHRNTILTAALLTTTLLAPTLNAEEPPDPFAPVPTGPSIEIDGSRIKATLAADARQFGRTMKGVWKELLPRTREDRAFLGGLAVTSVYLADHKESIRGRLSGTDFFLNDHWSQNAKPFGEWTYAAEGAILIYGVGLISDKPKVRETGLLMSEALIVTGVPMAFLQNVLAEQRPAEGGQMDYFGGGGHGASGHAATSMVVARVIDHQFLRLHKGEGRGRRAGKILGKIGLYAIPAATAWQRVREDRHYLWNVVLGSGVAFYTTGAVARTHDRVPDESRRSRYLPQVSLGRVDGEGPALQLAWSF